MRVNLSGFLLLDIISSSIMSLRLRADIQVRLIRFALMLSYNVIPLYLYDSS